MNNYNWKFGYQNSDGFLTMFTVGGQEVLVLKTFKLPSNREQGSQKANLSPYACICLNVWLTILFWIDFSTNYPGEYGFEISFATPSKETKSTTWTVSVASISQGWSGEKL